MTRWRAVAGGAAGSVVMQPGQNIREDQILPRLAALAILLPSHHRQEEGLAPNQ